MRKILTSLFILSSSQLFSDSNISNNRHQYDKIIEETLSSINMDYLNSAIDDNSVKNRFSIPYDMALKKAKDKKKMILLEVVLDNCKFCEKMDRLVLSKDSIQDTISKDFIFTQINADREPLPLGLREQMSPMFVFISKDEVVQDMRFGYIDESNFLNLLKEITKE